jgi:hypothetical protein
MIRKVGTLYMTRPPITPTQNNTMARDAFTRSITGGLSAGEAAEALLGQFSPDKVTYTYKDALYWSHAVHEERGRGEHRTLLERFGLSEIKALGSDMYRDFIEYCQCIVWYGIAPHHGWTGKTDVPEDLRDRWLFWHAESDDYFVVNSYDEAKKYFEFEGLEQVVDVAGIPMHEEAYLKYKDSL